MSMYGASIQFKSIQNFISDSQKIAIRKKMNKTKQKSSKTTTSVPISEILIPISDTGV